MLKIVGPILIGAVIGYCTNYIAIKMLFRPRREVFLGSWKLPFTPGVIPKNQKRIANAVGNAVSNQLITKEDLAAQIGASGVRNQIVTSVSECILQTKIKIDDHTATLEGMSDKISTDVVTGLQNADLKPTIRQIGNQALQEYLNNPMLAMILTEPFLDVIYAKIEESIKIYVSENGKQITEDFIQRKMESNPELCVGEVLDYVNVPERLITESIGGILDRFLADEGTKLLDMVDIKEIVTEKIEAMPVEELENLVLYVMENELKAIVNLGALIGAVIGTMNIFL